MFERCLLVDITLQCGATSNQNWNNVLYLNVGIYNAEKCPVNIVYFNVDMNNDGQGRNNVVILRSCFTTLVNVKITLWKWPFLKRKKNDFKYEFQSEFTLYSLPECQRTLWLKQASYMKFKWHQRNLNPKLLASLAKWLSVRLWTKWFRVWIPLPSLRIHGVQSFNFYFIISFILLPMLRKFLKGHEEYYIERN